LLLDLISQAGLHFFMMRAVPFGLDDISRLAAATAAPLLPLLLTIFSPEELIMRLVKIVF
jgi:hypothetical protein